jgi:hypothetical protein
MLRSTVFVSALVSFAWASSLGAYEDKKDKPSPPRSSVLSPSPADKDKYKYTLVNKQSVKLEMVSVKDRSIKISYTVTEGVGRNARTSEKTDELIVADDCRFRSLQLPETVDENGKIKKPSPDEIRKLKGSDPKLPGYTVDFDALSAGQQIEVTVSKLKENSATKKKDKTATAEKEPVVATLIVIQKDDRAQPPGNKGSGKR